MRDMDMELAAKLEAGRKAMLADGSLPNKAPVPMEAAKVTTPVEAAKEVPAAKKPAWVEVPAFALPYGKAVTRVPPSLEGSALAKTLSKDYGLSGALVTGTLQGPTVTTYLVELQKGTRAANLATRADDIARDLGIEHIRILDKVAGYPGCVGVEVPNDVCGTVSFRDTLMALKPGTLKLPIVLGATATGRPLCLDLAGMPHLLVAGTTGSGKSVFLHSVICSLAATISPDDLQLYLVDPKRVEFREYKTLPHVRKVAYEQEEVLAMLKDLVAAMDKRYSIFERVGAKDIVEFNGCDVVQAHPDIRLPYAVAVIDEFSDLMMAGDSRKEIEALIVRLAQKARAAGIHLVLATQRPAERVLTKDIRDNMPSRLAFRVADNAASRLILGERGAEDLLGKGDMLISTEAIPVTRIQGAFLDQETIKAVVRISTGGGL